MLDVDGLRVSGLEWPGPTLEQPWVPGALLDAAAMTRERSLWAAGPPNYATGLANLRACRMSHAMAA